MLRPTKAILRLMRAAISMTMLNAVDAAGEAGEQNVSRGRAAKFFQARDYGAIGRREAGALDVGGVAEKREDAFLP